MKPNNKSIFIIALPISILLLVSAITFSRNRMLAYAVKCNTAILIKPLVLLGADINSFDKEGYTPLIRSLKNSDRKIAEILLKNNADPNKKLTKELSPLQLSLLDANHDLLSLLLRFGANPNELIESNNSPILYTAIGKGDAKATEILIRFGAKISETSQKYSPLQVAAMKNHVDIVKILKAHGAVWNPKDSTDRAISKYLYDTNQYEIFKELHK